MKPLRWIPAAVLALVVVAALIAVFQATQAPPEPEWGGRKLREWLRVGSSIGTFGQVRPEELETATTALVEMGRECFPYMLMMMRARDARWQFQLSSLLSKQNLIKFRPPPRPSYEGRWQAARGFARLGTNAAPAVPGLCRLLHDPDTSSQASYALIQIDTREATDAVERALDDKDASLRQTVSAQLGATGGNGRKFVPALLRGLNDPDSAVREHCAYALGEIGKNPMLVVPGLATRLADRVPDVSRAAAGAVGKFGDQAKRAVPELVRLAQRNDPTTYAAAVRALARIDTEAAKLFPAYWTPTAAIATNNRDGRRE